MLNIFKSKGGRPFRSSTSRHAPFAFVNDPIFVSSKLRLEVIGKVFRWFFHKRKIRFVLNRSHPSSMYFADKLRFVKLFTGKYNNDVIFLSPIKTSKLVFFLRKARRSNIFTKRGLFIDQAYGKKTGKISSYV